MRGLCCRMMSVCLSVCSSVTRWHCIETDKHIIKLFFNINIPTRTPLTGTSNAQGMKKSRFSTNSNLIWEMIQDMTVVTMTR